jgi:Glycosyltransferase family 87
VKRLPALAVAASITMLALAYAVHFERRPVTFTRDFDQFYAAARFVSQGRNPYALIGPGRAFQWDWPFFYPLPAALLALPLAWLPLPIARVAFVGLTCLLFTYALGRVGGTRWRYITIVSKPFEVALLTGQLSFLLASAYVLPVVAALACVKPNIGAAIVGARADRRTIILALAGGMVLLGVSFAVQPTWVRDWLAAVHRDPFQRPAVLRSGGFLLLLAGLKWRRPEARLLLGLSLVPQTLGMYDALLLFFIPRRANEYLILAILSHVAVLMLWNDTSIRTMDAFIVAGGDAVVHWMFLPALCMVLLRPNVAVAGHGPHAA